MRIDRRKALGLLGGGAAAPAAAKVARASPAAGPQFRWGVASGDPLADRVILWTACASDGAVAWELARDAAFRTVVRRGGAQASPARDRTVKVDVAGLKPGTDYFYRFRKDGQVSAVGRTRTLPKGPTPAVVLAFASCALIPAGYFNAYQAIADLPRVDAVVHLGDYIYEYGGPGSYGADSPVAQERAAQPPHDCVTLADYRTRLAQYRLDPQLQAAHARAPWIVVWDDHETANDSWRGGAQNHRADEGDWSLRKAAAIKAYYEWMPIREPADGGFAIWRSFDFGDLASLFMLETRLTARDQQLTYADVPTPATPQGLAGFRARLNDPARRMMSPGQEAWLGEGLSRSVAAGRPWQVLGNQVLMARIQLPDPALAAPPAALAEAAAKASPYVRRMLGVYAAMAPLDLPYLLDSWDGYPADRDRLLALIRKAGANVLVVSGDSHAFWANAVHHGAAGGDLAAVEIGVPGITSPGLDLELPGLALGPLFVRRNPEVLFSDQGANGFGLVTLTREAAVTELVAVSTVAERSYRTRVIKRYRTTPGPDGIGPLTEI
jgi:alkaline phosphatase D